MFDVDLVDCRGVMFGDDGLVHVPTRGDRESAMIR
jgi:hypothetical protein